MTVSLSAEECARYARQIKLPEIGEAGQVKLKQSSVLVVGTGGLGSPLAFYLAAAGIGCLGLVDSDRVERSNLQRQILHTTPRLGEMKVDSAYEQLFALNPEIRIERFAERFIDSQAENIARGYDVIADGSDNFETRYAINRYCAAAGRPYVYGAVFHYEGQVSVFDISRGPCYACLYPNELENVKGIAQLDNGILGATAGVVGSMQALEVIKLLLGIGEGLVGRLMLFDGLDMSTQVVKIARNPSCPVCGSR